MKHTILLLLIGLYLPFFSSAQHTAQHVYTLEQIFELTLKNNQSLKISNSAVEVAKQRVEVAKLQRLPNLGASVTAGYMGDALVIDNDFSSSTRIPVPHFTNTFALEASQVIFKGNAVNNSIASTSLLEQVSLLNMQENTLGINLLVAGNYLDLYAYYNQRDVYEQNIALAKMRLVQIEKFYHQGMVTRNDVIRSELQIADLNLALVSVKNQIDVVNKQLATATGLPDSVSILPDTTILNRNLSISSLEASQQRALNTHPAIQSADIRTQIAEKNLAITKADRLPTLSAFAGNNMQRPITTSSPAVDKYSNGWQAGLSLSYNIASLYDAPKNIHLSKLQVDEASEQAILARQNKEVAVNAVYIAHQEALTRAQTLQQNVRLANENYRIIEKKYMNQLALLVDMLDASNAKLGAELQQTNAAINVLYTYYQLQAEIGAQ